MSNNFCWDKNKRSENLNKHGLDFIDADMVLDNPYRLDISVTRNNENRIQSIAYVFEVLVVLTVVHIERSEGMRIISFRPASAEERSGYYEWLENDFDDNG